MVTQSESGPAKDAIASDRRRPGRIETTNDHLIALFRDPASVAPIPETEAADQIAPRPPLNEAEEDQLAAARGIAIGVLGGAFLWGVLGFCIWRFW